MSGWQMEGNNPLLNASSPVFPTPEGITTPNASPPILGLDQTWPGPLIDGFPTTNCFNGFPVLTSNGIVVLCTNGLSGYNQSDGTQTFQGFSLPGVLGGAPYMLDGNSAYGGFTDDSGTVKSIDITSGNVNWSVSDADASNNWSWVLDSANNHAIAFYYQPNGSVGAAEPPTIKFKAYNTSDGSLAWNSSPVPSDYFAILPARMLHIPGTDGGPGQIIVCFYNSSTGWGGTTDEQHVLAISDVDGSLLWDTQINDPAIDFAWPPTAPDEQPPAGFDSGPGTTGYGFGSGDGTGTPGFRIISDGTYIWQNYSTYQAVGGTGSEFQLQREYLLKLDPQTGEIVSRTRSYLATAEPGHGWVINQEDARDILAISSDGTLMLGARNFPGYPLQRRGFFVERPTRTRRVALTHQAFHKESVELSRGRVMGFVSPIGRVKRPRSADARHDWRRRYAC